MFEASKQTQANSPRGSGCPCAAELLALIEDGHEDEALARIQSLSQRDFIQHMRSVQTLERGLSNYALS